MANSNENKLTILRRPQVEERIGLSRATIYAFMEKGNFPKPISLGPRAVGWLSGEIDTWVLERVKARDGNHQAGVAK